MRPPRAEYDARLALPFAVIGVRVLSQAVVGLDFLPADTPALASDDPLVAAVHTQLLAYLDTPSHRFDLPIRLHGSPFRQRVWAVLREIPAGETRTYGDLARQLHSSPRAVGQALGDNPLPIVLPCHRVISSAGLGGFNHHAAGTAIEIKRWLLRHEHAI